MNEFYIRNIVEAALLAAGKSLQLPELGQLFDESARPKADDIRAALEVLVTEYSSRGVEIKETAAGFRIQVRKEFATEISRLWPERPAKYSRALLETLALIAYRQPITRAEIEAVRGVAVNPNILKTVIERNWVRVVGHRDVPGRPELLGTTREFLDYFGLRSLDELPPLAELKTIGEYNLQLELPNAGALGIESTGDGAGGGELGTAEVADVAVAGLLVAEFAGTDIAGPDAVEGGSGDVVESVAAIADVVSAEGAAAGVGDAEAASADAGGPEAANVNVIGTDVGEDAAGSEPAAADVRGATGVDVDAGANTAGADGPDTAGVNVAGADFGGDAAATEAAAAGVWDATAVDVDVVTAEFGEAEAADIEAADAEVGSADVRNARTASADVTVEGFGGADAAGAGATGDVASVEVTLVEFEGVELGGPDLAASDIAEAPSVEWSAVAASDAPSAAANGEDSDRVVADEVSAAIAADGDEESDDDDEGIDDAEADRTLSVDFAADTGDTSNADATDLDDSEPTDSTASDKPSGALGDASADDDDDDEDELSADGHDSRELVAAPRDIDD